MGYARQTAEFYRHYRRPNIYILGGLHDTYFESGGAAGEEHRGC